MINRRKLPRKKAAYKVMINHPEYGQVVGCMRDMSKDGILIEVDPSKLFVCGQIFGVHITGISDANIDPLLSMEVVQVELSGIALKFVEAIESNKYSGRNSETVTKLA